MDVAGAGKVALRALYTLKNGPFPEDIDNPIDHLQWEESVIDQAIATIDAMSNGESQ